MIHSPELADWIDAMFFRPRSNHFLTSVANSGTQAVETKGRWRVLRIIYCHWPGRYCRRAYNIVTGHTILSPAGHILRRAYIVTGRADIVAGHILSSAGQILSPGTYCRRRQYLCAVNVDIYIVAGDNIIMIGDNIYRNSFNLRTAR